MRLGGEMNNTRETLLIEEPIEQKAVLYIPMNDVWGPDGETFDTGLEPLMVAAAERGHHLVLRVLLMSHIKIKIT